MSSAGRGYLAWLSERPTGPDHRLLDIASGSTLLYVVYTADLRRRTRGYAVVEHELQPIEDALVCDVLEQHLVGKMPMF
jgi:hypothetical protein